jgi:hypothetical protein
MSSSGLKLLSGNLYFLFSSSYRVLEPAYMPAKIELSITAIPVMTRNMVSNEFSLKKYATGNLLRGSQNNSGRILVMSK